MNRQPEYHFFHFAGKSNPTRNKPQPVVKPKSYNDKFQVDQTRVVRYIFGSRECIALTLKPRNDNQKRF